ncbi:MAG: hypothetical protein IT384_31680 [Deltaproteobacteria bacterium]|nr:hypothetical protein [Deltaproteobacteria bacterium]
MSPTTHGPIEKLSPRVWRVEGEVPRFPLKRVMTVVRLSDERLLVHSAIVLEERAMQEIDAWGEVGFIVAPSRSHRLGAGPFKQRYPKAKVLCPPAARRKVAQVVPVDGVLADFPTDERVRLELLDGTAAQEGVLIVHDDAGTTLVFNDCIFNMPHPSGLIGWVLRYLTASSGGPRISRVSRLVLIKDRRAFSAHLSRLAAIPDLVRVIVSHHLPIDHAPSEVLRALAASL